MYSLTRIIQISGNQSNDMISYTKYILLIFIAVICEQVNDGKSMNFKIGHFAKDMYYLDIFKPCLFCSYGSSCGPILTKLLNISKLSLVMLAVRQS